MPRNHYRLLKCSIISSYAFFRGLFGKKRPIGTNWGAFFTKDPLEYALGMIIEFCKRLRYFAMVVNLISTVPIRRYRASLGLKRTRP